MRAIRTATLALLGAGLLALGGSSMAAWSGQLEARATSAEDALTSNDGAYLVSYELSCEEVEVRELFDVHVAVARADGEASELSLALDARMPEHGHGMNREPQITRNADGSFDVKGLLFHMPGHWEIYFDITEGAICERAQVSLELE